MLEQEDDLIPHTTETLVGSGPVLVLAPHPDDEVLGCGGALALHRLASDPVHVVIVTDGGAQDGGEGGSRYEESRKAGEVLGYTEIESWEFPDRGLEYGEELIGRVSRRIQETGARLVYGPSPNEIHPDHRALFFCLAEAARRLGGDASLILYEVSGALPPNLLIDITSVFERKMQAVACFRSQLRVRGYDRYVEGLNKYRTYSLDPEVRYAEAYLQLRFDEAGRTLLSSSATGPAPLLEARREERPLVSLIIRSIDRPYLHEALRSIELQTYPNIEILVVNARGVGHAPLSDRCGRFPLRLVSAESARNRSSAANLGLAEARGDYIGFLDDDDLLYPNHVLLLMDKLESAPEVGVAYNGIRIEHYDARGQLQDVSLLNEPYDSRRLRIQNYLPIQAVLFSRSLVEAGAQFDESLSLYEDWDFWLQLAQSHVFLATDRIGGISRNLGGSGLTRALPGQETATQAARRLREKWLRRWPVAEVSDLFDYLLAANNPWHRHWQEALAQTQREASDLREQLHRLQTRIRELETMTKFQESQTQRLHEQVQTMLEHERGTSRCLLEQTHRADGLETQITFLYASTSWRITAPLRGIKQVGRVMQSFFRVVGAHGGGLAGLGHMGSRLFRGLRRYGLGGALRRGLSLIRRGGRN